MPIDKFGRHMLRATPYSNVQPSIDSTSFFLCQPTEFKSPCVLYINGVYDINKSVSFFRLHNGELEYKSPISGVIDQVVITPNIKIFKNELDWFDGTLLKDKKIQKGDKLRFFTESEHKTLYAEITVLCPLLKNE